MWWIIGLSSFIIGCLIAFVIMLNRGIIAFVHLNKIAKKQQIRVACVGDSITYGYGVKGWIKNNYPARLGKMLGKDYCVHNYGHCGATASIFGDPPFMNIREYKKSLKFKPDIVILMLGTNDSKPHNWKSGEKYIDDISRIAASYQNSNKKTSLYVLAPPPAFTEGDGLAKFNVDPTVLIEIEFMINNLKDYAVIDLHKEFENKNELFWDGVHPNKEGCIKIASYIFKSINEKGE